MMLEWASGWARMRSAAKKLGDQDGMNVSESKKGSVFLPKCLLSREGCIFAIFGTISCLESLYKVGAMEEGGLGVGGRPTGWIVGVGVSGRPTVPRSLTHHLSPSIPTPAHFLRKT